MNGSRTQVVNVRAIQALVAKRAKPRWLSLPVVVFGVLAPVGIGIQVQAEHLAGALLAYINCLITGYACMRFFKGHWLPGAIPLLFLPNTVISWCFAPLCFAMFFPDHTYGLMRPMGGNSALYRLAHYQLVTTMFLLPYIGVVWLFVKKSRDNFHGSRFESNRKALAYSCSFIVLGVLGYNAAARLANLSEAATYWADGLFKYYKTLMIAVGAFFLRIDRLTRYTLLGILIGFGILYTLANKREFAAYPLLSLAIGILFFSGVRPNSKTMFVGVVMLVLPVYFTLGDVTRRVGGLAPGFENLGRRMQIITGRSGEYLEKVNPIGATLGRFFTTGGHSVVVHTPENVPYMGFNPGKYVSEMFRSLVPRRQMTMADYGHNYHLVRYGHRVTDKTAVGVTLIGHFWMLGGTLFIIAGGVLTGLFHGALVMMVRRAWSHSMAMALILIAVQAHALIWVRGYDFIRHWRDVVWRLVFAVVIYVLYRIFAGTLRRATSPEDTYPALPMKQPRVRSVAGWNQQRLTGSR
ncbi:MAG: hypothetical protein ABIG44_03425 [Planctomycetota bacterium]